METEILHQLTIIKWLLMGILIVLSIVSFAIIMGGVINRRMLASNIDLRMRDTLIAEAQMHESKGENQKFLETSEKLVDLYPSDVNAIWYYALANYKNNQLGTALSAFAEIKQVDRAWCSDIVDDYIATIKSEMDGPKIV